MIERDTSMMRYLIAVFTIPSLIILLLIGLGYAQDLAEGKKLYSSYCAGCHGEKGKGDGVAARSLPAKPTDHTNGKTMNAFSDKYLGDIIAKGGSAVGKSAFMPAWGNQLKEGQIQALVTYIRSLAVPAYKP